MMETGWTGSIFCPHHFEHTGKVRETVKTKQLLCGVLAAAVLFTGCGAQPGTSGGSSAQGDGTPMQAKGRFVENDITPPGAAGCTLVSLTARPDGGLDYIALRPAETPGQYTYTHFYSADSGKEWTENTMDWQESFGEKRQIEKVTVIPEGEYFVMLTEQTEDGMGAVAYARVAADGTAVPVQPEGLSAQGGLVAADAQVLPGGRLLLTSFGGDFAAVQNGAAGEDAGAQAASSGTQDAAGETDDAEAADGTEQSGDDMGVFSAEDTATTAVYDMATGKKLYEIPNWMGGLTACNGTTLFVYGYEGGTAAYDLETGHMQTEAASAAGGEDYPSSLAADADGNLYLLSEKGVRRAVPGGTLAETVMEGSMYTFGSPLAAVRGFTALPGNTFALAVQTEEGGRVLHYVFDETVSAVPDKEVRVYALNDSPTVRAAITNFQQENPDVRVNFEVGTSGGASAEDALRTLNTELVAGKGPDVLILDGMPLQSFIDKGVLAELSQVISADGLIPQVVDPMRTDGKLYAVPTRFTVPVLMGKPETLEGLDSLEALAAAVQDGPEALAASGDINDIFKAVPEEQRPLLSFTTLRELFDQLYSVSAPAVVRDGTLNEAALRELFSVMQAVSDRYGLGKKANDGGIAFMVTSNASTGLGMSADVPQGVMEYSYGRANAALFTLKDVLGAYMSDDGQAALTPAPGMEQGVYTPRVLAGITAQSAQQELAAQFIQALLAPGVQNYSLGEGLPVLRSGLEKQVAYVQELYAERGQTIGTDVPRVDWTALLSGLKTPVRDDSTVAEKLYAQAEALCKGEKTMDEAVTGAKTELATYLAEKRA